MPEGPIAIQPDRLTRKDGTVVSWSDRWLERARDLDIPLRTVDLLGTASPLSELRDCRGLLWRFLDAPRDRWIADRILHAAEYAGLWVFPNQSTRWHYDDKAAQALLFDALSVPTPRTWVFWRPRDAVRFCRGATYPLVLKLAQGAASKNVVLLQDAEEATETIRLLFLDRRYRPEQALRIQKSAVGRVQTRLTRRFRRKRPGARCVLLQEFVAGNDFDTRITVVGGRAFGFRRLNREGDFRASGSGRIDWDPDAIDPRMVSLALRFASTLKTQSAAFDFLLRDDAPLVGEISYTYVADLVARCPGHWIAEEEDGELSWVEGHLRPEDAILEDCWRALSGGPKPERTGPGAAAR